MTTMPVRWGVLGVALIATGRALPPLAGSRHTTVAAIASRSEAKAKAAAQALGVPRAYGSYEELLADPTIEAVYNPLPNHLHAEWTVRALEAGKHVLCEKPLALTGAEVERMQKAARDAGLLLAEAFMLFSHPRIRALRTLVRDGAIGRLGSVQFSFSNPNFIQETFATGLRPVAVRSSTRAATWWRSRATCSMRSQTPSPQQATSTLSSASIL